MSEPDHKLYEKIVDILIVLRDTRENFIGYSASDIKKLIAAKMKAVRREPKALEQLYRLEAMITDLRKTLIIAKEDELAY
jgi:hypothetical protein